MKTFLFSSYFILSGSPGDEFSQPRQSKSVFKNYQRCFWSFWNILVRCGSLWIVLGSLWVVVDRFGFVVDRFGSFWVVPRFSIYVEL